MRGKGPDDRAHPLVPGITPACAGKRKPHLHKKGCTWDHPRVCGEKCPNCGRKMKQQGSPPRMRGKDGVNDSAQAVTGITPAYAGKRLLVLPDHISGQDHPRVCGEKMVSMIPHRRSRGSPPRMRGKGCLYFLTTSAARITPAYAGKSDDKADDELNAEGSPPRMRGKAPSFSSSLVVGRITPAYAGKR